MRTVYDAPFTAKVDNSEISGVCQRNLVFPAQAAISLRIRCLFCVVIAPLLVEAGALASIRQ